MAMPKGMHNPIRQAANSIIGKEGSPTTPEMPEDLSAAKPTKHSFHHISVKPQSDGSIAVTHQSAPPDYDKPGPSDNEVISTHATPAAAHQHLGKIMGVGAVAPTTHAAPEAAAGASGSKVPLSK
jgi:hypothetical protein